ncbi:MAG: hypothetical protein ACTHOG_13015 [Marmoricola sp.]
MRTIRLVLFAALVGTITAIALILWRQGDNLFGPSDGCTAQVDGNSASLDTGQAQYAGLIAALGVRRGLPARAVSIALATAYQESKIQNLPGGDADSLGLFQQRPSQGWGTAAEIMDPVYATNAFYDALVKIKNYQSLDITVAAQEVQHSAYPGAYAQHETEARVVASALTGYSPAAFTCVVTGDKALGTGDSVISTLSRGFGTAISPRRSLRQNVAIPVGSGTAGQRLGWAVAQYAVAIAPDLHIKSVLFDGKQWRTGSASSKGWTPASSASSSTVSIVMEPVA